MTQNKALLNKLPQFFEAYMLKLKQSKLMTEQQALHTICYVDVIALIFFEKKHAGYKKSALRKMY